MSRKDDILRINMNKATKQIDNAKMYQKFITDPEEKDYFLFESVDEQYSEQEKEDSENEKVISEKIKDLLKIEREYKELPAVYYNSNKKSGMKTHFAWYFGLVSLFCAVFLGYPFSLMSFPLSLFGIISGVRAIYFYKEENKKSAIFAIIVCACAVLLFGYSLKTGWAKVLGLF